VLRMIIDTVAALDHHGWQEIVDAGPEAKQ
jgi:hypothetical protein